jgi:hypothetical protein
MELPSIVRSPSQFVPYCSLARTRLEPAPSQEDGPHTDLINRPHIIWEAQACKVLILRKLRILNKSITEKITHFGTLCCSARQMQSRIVCDMCHESTHAGDQLSLA